MYIKLSILDNDNCVVTLLELKVQLSLFMAVHHCSQICLVEIGTGASVYLKFTSIPMYTDGSYLFLHHVCMTVPMLDERTGMMPEVIVICMM